MPQKNLRPTWGFSLSEQRRTLLYSFAFRFVFLFVLWLLITLPYHPAWRVSGGHLFHVAVALFGIGYGLAFRQLLKTNHPKAIFTAVCGVEFAALTTLVWATGGLSSPFTILILISITATLFQGNLRDTLLVCLMGIAIYGAFIFLHALKKLPEYAPFMQDGAPIVSIDNGAYLATTIALIALYTAFTITLNVYLFRRLRAQSEAIANQDARLNEANHALISSFYDLESLSDRLKVSRESTESARQDLMRLEKMSSLGRLAAGIINELGSPLSSIISDTEILLMAESLPPAAQIRDTLKSNLAGAARIKALMQNLKESIKPTEAMQFESLDLNMLVVRSSSLVAHEMRSRSIRFSATYDQSDPRIHGVRSQIEQCLINLLSNAGQSCEPGQGVVTVETRVAENQAHVVVTDNGHGIGKEEMGRIFEPFYTTRQDESHVGLGLYIVANIVDVHKGHLLVESIPGKQTTFTVALPLTPPRTEK